MAEQQQAARTVASMSSRGAAGPSRLLLAAAALVVVSAFGGQVLGNLSVTAPPASSSARSFIIDYEQDAFLKDGQPFRIVSGSFHYFRVPRLYWRDRLRKLRQAGLNTVATCHAQGTCGTCGILMYHIRRNNRQYVEWSLHEASPSQYNFSGELNLLHFIRLAAEEGLLVNLRVGPYICAERDMGGLPPWLLSVKPDMKLRTRDPVFQFYAKRWLDVLLPHVKHMLYGKGGPIILVQVENEYGSYPACDRQYLTWLRDLFRDHVGTDAVLYTTDGAGDSYLACGKIPGVYATVDFGASSDPVAAFAAQRRAEPRGPLVNSEYYTGWLTHWAEREQGVAAADVAKGLRWMLANNASFNFYVFMGGSNFGFTAGANFGKDFQPQITSYDYDAPLTEAGDPTDKYFIIRNTIEEFVGRLPAAAPAPRAAPKLAFGPILLQRVADLEALAEGPPLAATFPRDFEQLRQSYGYILYETRIPDNLKKSNKSLLLLAPDVRDRGIVFLDEVRVGVVCRTRPQRTGLLLGSPAPRQRLAVLVENQGRINYGGRLNDTKGLGNVTLDGRLLTGWTMRQYPLANATLLDAALRRAARPARHLRRQGRPARGGVVGDPKRHVPGLYLGRFVLPVIPTLPAARNDDSNGTSYADSLPDSFLDTSGWGKGVVFVNGFNLGRYWPAVGPQVTLYVPGAVLRAHPTPNTVVMLETDSAPQIPTLNLVTQPRLNGTVCGSSTATPCC